MTPEQASELAEQIAGRLEVKILDSRNNMGVDTLDALNRGMVDLRNEIKSALLSASKVQPGHVRDENYQLGNNCAGETAAQVANYITSDLRVLLGAYPEVVDKISDSIASAIRESAQAAGREGV